MEKKSNNTIEWYLKMSTITIVEKIGSEPSSLKLPN